MPYDVRPTTNNAPASDPDGRGRQHGLIAVYSRTQTDVRSDKGPVANREVSLVIDNPLGCHERTAAAEVEELPGVVVVGSHHGHVVEIPAPASDPGT